MSLSVINIIYLIFMQKEGTIANGRGTACHASLYSYYFAEFRFFELKVTMLTVGGAWVALSLLHGYRFRPWKIWLF